MKIYITFILLLAFTALNAQNDEKIELAYQQHAKKQFTKAIKTIDEILEENPIHEEAYFLKGECLTLLKKYQEAYNVLSEGIERIEEAASLYHSRALLLIGSNEFELAIKNYNKAIEFAPNDTLKHLTIVNRGSAKRNMMDFEGAYNDYMLSYKFDSTDIATLNNLAMVSDEVGRGDETLKYLYRIIEIDSTLTSTYVNIGFKHQVMGEHKKAIEFYSTAIEMDEKSPLGYSNRAYSYYHLGNQKLALKDIDYSIKLYPSNAYAYWVRSLIYIKEGDINKACLDLDMALHYGYGTMYGDEVEQLIFEYCE